MTRNEKMHKQKILNEAKKMRAAFEYLLKHEKDFIEEHLSEGGDELVNFPEGSCAIASNFLGVCLQGKGYSVTIAECGNSLAKYKGIVSHAWVVCNGYWVDITFDQFNCAYYEKVIVVEQAEESVHKELSKAEDNVFRDDSLPQISPQPSFSDRALLYKKVMNIRHQM